MTRSFALLLGLGLAAGSAVAQAPGAPATSTHLAIRAARLIDGRGGAPIQNAVILVDSSRVTAAWPRRSLIHASIRTVDS